jgi:hypothetical protein
MFDKQDASFEVTVLANQNDRYPSIVLSVCRNEILEIRGVVVQLATAQAEFTNRRDKCPNLPFTDKHFRGSFAAFEQGAGSSYIGHRIISQGVMDSEQTG